MIKNIILLIVTVSCLWAKTYRFTNELIHSHSSYLLQHAHNPVHWHSWNKSAFKLAKKEHKLIFLSIGYSTCHWCHVMEKQSFSHVKVANILNKYYIAIAVDKEQRPDIDKHFQAIYTILHKNSGGWPLTVILTPNARPFFTATYMPRESRDGYLGLLNMLKYFAKLSKYDNAKITQIANQISQIINTISQEEILPKATIGASIIHNFIKGVEKKYDKDNPGIGIEPKFPHASIINALLDIYKYNRNKKALYLATQMLNTMANGGIYDQLSGGFFRYTTDARWTTPHFEKMLYTNAQLLKAYVKAYEITKKPLYLHVIIQTISFIKKRFEKNNLFFSAIDADSYDVKTKQLQEGAYYSYKYNNAKHALRHGNIKNYRAVLAYFEITKDGNFKNQSSNIYINQFVKTPKDIVKAKKILLMLRHKKKYPFIDRKILTSWNALYIQALCTASNLNHFYLNSATKSLNSLLGAVYIKHILYHDKISSTTPTIKANFEDYTFLTSLLITAYEKTYNNKYLNLANILVKQTIKRFYIKKIWYFATKPYKIKSTLYNNAYVSPLSIMIDNLLKLAVLEENLSYQNLAKVILIKNAFLLAKYPSIVSQAVVEYIKYKKGFIIVKAKKDALLRVKTKLKDIYPFILYKVTKNKKYLACMIDKCFAYEANPQNIIKIIQKR